MFFYMYFIASLIHYHHCVFALLISWSNKWGTHKKKCTTYEFLVLFIFYFIFFIGTILILPSLISLMVPWLINKILHKKKRKLTMYESPILFFSFFRLCIFCLPFIASILTYMSFILPMGVISKRQDIK